jgi:hypothetical protein
MGRLMRLRLRLDYRFSSPTLTRTFGFKSMTKTWANKPAAGNAGIASRLAIEHNWPGVGEPER